MSSAPDLHELQAEVLRLLRSIDGAIDEVENRSVEMGAAITAYRQAKATAYLAAEGHTVAEKQSRTDKAVREEMKRAKTAEALRSSAVEALRARRDQITAVQSLLATAREQMRLAR